jgi:hypothetical protein
VLQDGRNILKLFEISGFKKSSSHEFCSLIGNFKREPLIDIYIIKFSYLSVPGSAGKTVFNKPRQMAIIQLCGQIR